MEEDVVGSPPLGAGQPHTPRRPWSCCLDPFHPPAAWRDEARRGLCAPAPELPQLPVLASPGTSLPPRRRAGAPTTSFSSPTKEVPLPLGEFLSWVSDVSKSWMGSRGAWDATPPRPCSPAQCGWMSIPTPLTAATEPVPPSWGQWDRT
ncbi:uncharacterized protein FYN16_001465 [Cariama cristata]